MHAYMMKGFLISAFLFLGIKPRQGKVIAKLLVFPFRPVVSAQHLREHRGNCLAILLN